MILQDLGTQVDEEIEQLRGTYSSELKSAMKSISLPGEQRLFFASANGDEQKTPTTQEWRDYLYTVRKALRQLADDDYYIQNDPEYLKMRTYLNGLERDLDREELHVEQLV